MERVLPQVPAFIESLSDADFKKTSDKVTMLTEAVLLAASSSNDGSTLEVLLAISRSFAVIWMGLEGPSEHVQIAFTECLVHSGLMVMSDNLQLRLHGPSHLAEILAKEQANNPTETTPEGQKEGSNAS